MKCRYSYCKHDNEVSKEDAVKEGNSYYHKDCLEEKTIKQQINSNVFKIYIEWLNIESIL